MQKPYIWIDPTNVIAQLNWILKPWDCFCRCLKQVRLETANDYNAFVSLITVSRHAIEPFLSLSPQSKEGYGNTITLLGGWMNYIYSAGKFVSQRSRGGKLGGTKHFSFNVNATYADVIGKLEEEFFPGGKNRLVGYLSSMERSLGDSKAVPVEPEGFSSLRYATRCTTKVARIYLLTKRVCNFYNMSLSMLDSIGRISELKQSLCDVIFLNQRLTMLLYFFEIMSFNLASSSPYVLPLVVHFMGQ